MKKTRIFSIVALLALLCIPGLSRAQQTLTVYDGTATSSYVPVYGFYCDAYLKCEFVIPASELTDMIGSTISQMDFYASTPAEEAWTGTFQVFLKEVEADTLNAYSGTTDATIVYTGTLDGTGSIMTVEFDNDYLYNGGNLLVGFYLIATGNYKSVDFYGQSISYNCCMQGYDYNSLDGVSANQRNFIPKTTFTYTPLPEGVMIGDPTSTSTSYNIPVSNFYNYSLSESIINASEIGGAMNIGSISYKYASSTSMRDTTCGIKIWLKPTTKTQFSSSTDMEPVDNTATLVYDGPFSCSTGWNEITFTTPYAYNGSDNLMVIVCDTTFGYDGTTYEFSTTNYVNNMTISWRSDTEIPDPTSTTFGGTKSIESSRPLMVLGEVPVPLAVTISGPMHGAVGNTLAFTATSADDATIEWTLQGATPSTATGASVSATWNIAGTYTVTCTATRGSETASDAITVTIAYCGDALQLPFTCGFEPTDNLACWNFIDANEDGYGWTDNETMSEIEQWSEPADTYHNGTGCYMSASYVNGDAVTPDNWMITPRLHIPDNGATLEWWDYAIHSDYAEHYSVLVSSNGTETTEITDTLFETTLSEGLVWAQRNVSLDAYAGQDIHIAFRHHDCTDQYILCIDDISVTSNGVGINNANTPRVSVYPNPATNIVNVSAEALREVSILDLNGRVLATTDRNRVDVSDLAAGVYFVRVVTANGVAIEKIVKK